MSFTEETVFEVRSSVAQWLGLKPCQYVAIKESRRVITSNWLWQVILLVMQAKDVQTTL